MPKSYAEKYEEPMELGTIFNNRLEDLKSEIKVQLPCKVQSVNHQTNQVSVEILDYSTDEDGNIIPYPVIPNVPIRQPMDSASAYIRLPIKVGDVGTIEFFDSSVADLQTNSIHDYDHTEQWHSLNNGLFTNGFLPKNKLFEFDYNSKLVIGTKDNIFTFKVNSANELIVEATNVKVTASGDVSVNATAVDVNVSGDVTINAPAGVNVNSPDMTVSGNVNVGTGASGTVACGTNTLSISNGIVVGLG